MPATTILKPLSRHRTAVLTTYGPDGLTPQTTQVRFVIDGDRVLVGVPRGSAHQARLDEHPVADLTPCTLRGTVAGSPVRARVRGLDGGDARRAGMLLTKADPFRMVRPLTLTQFATRLVCYALEPLPDQDNESVEGAPE
ncbi:PPOX class F420-dependent oxidoreductase [Spiractinospora alimapuensis]|uniref:PPOX class F420-dependent oxidoreductase n=1 Tax=Spiractinospora alimapuensis TaxID=2820884 RepID=UPI001F1A5A10|nr:PPOX class F420-dependent oxidoreductase [Spiractinospora alimapuensis]QVQ50440.1 PPOX class F420-dependent oxidoreductase [Spiractinospora alimapuensis]